MWWLLVAASAWAADWVTLQGTEPPGGSDAPRPWGFLQVLGEGIVLGEPVTGLSGELAAFEGQWATFSRVGSGSASWGLSLRRARMGMRGTLPGSRGHIGYLIAVELGDSQTTRADPVVLTDASVTFSYLPGVRVRAGQFKLPLGEEALEANAIAAEFVNFSAATSTLLVENVVVEGAYQGGGSAFRDLGVQLFDAQPVGRGEVSYALMGSNGRMGTLEVDNPKDITARVAYSPLVWGDPHDNHRDELGAWLFHHQGQRTLDGTEASRMRQGFGVKLERKGFQARTELIRAVGMVEMGATPSFAGQPIAVALNGRALGAYVYGHYETEHLGGGLRYDELHRWTDTAADTLVGRTFTVDLQVMANARARVLLDYEVRRLAAPHGTADVRRVLATLGDRVAAQVAVVF